MRLDIRSAAFILFIFSFQSSLVFAQKKSLKVPKGRAIMVDGKCERGEWSDAASVKTSRKYQLFFKQNKDFIFVCVASDKPENLMIDFYIAAENKKPYTLHASAKLGERVLSSDKWQDFTGDWNWWQIDGWTANTLRVDSFEKRTFLPSEAIEFQIDRRVFGGKTLSVMFNFLTDGSVFPLSADNLNITSWQKLKLDR